MPGCIHIIVEWTKKSLQILIKFQTKFIIHYEMLSVVVLLIWFNQNGTTISTPLEHRNKSLSELANKNYIQYVFSCSFERTDPPNWSNLGQFKQFTKVLAWPLHWSLITDTRQERVNKPPVLTIHPANTCALFISANLTVLSQ